MPFRVRGTGIDATSSSARIRVHRSVGDYAGGVDLQRTTVLRLRIGLLIAMVGVQMVSLVSNAPPSYALSNGSGPGIGVHGFDTCQDPSQSTMNAWWHNTPWSWVGVYIGGSEMAGSQPSLTSAWLNNQNRVGWRFSLK